MLFINRTPQTLPVPIGLNVFIVILQVALAFFHEGILMIYHHPRHTHKIQNNVFQKLHNR